MKKIILFALSLLALSQGFAETLIFNNQTSYPTKNLQTKMAIQWAATAQEVQTINQSSTFGLNPNVLHVLNRAGKIDITIPETAEYFRVVVWSKEAEDPDFLTNWVDIVPNKTYTLQADQLIPAVLMPGMGC